MREDLNSALGNLSLRTRQTILARKAEANRGRGERKRVCEEEEDDPDKGAFEFRETRRGRR